MKKHQSIFPLIFAIYVIAGILAIVLFYNNGSRLSRRLAQSALTENESVSAMTDSQESESAPDDTQSPEVVETPASETPETDTDDIIEGTDHAVSDAATSPVSDAAVADSENSGNTTEAAISTDEIADTDQPISLAKKLLRPTLKPMIRRMTAKPITVIRSIPVSVPYASEKLPTEAARSSVM